MPLLLGRSEWFYKTNLPLFSGVGSEPWAFFMAQTLATKAKPVAPWNIPPYQQLMLSSTTRGIGATIMGISLFIGRLVTPYAEKAFAPLDEKRRQIVGRAICSKNEKSTWLDMTCFSFPDESRLMEAKIGKSPNKFTLLSTGQGSWRCILQQVWWLWVPLWLSSRPSLRPSVEFIS